MNIVLFGHDDIASFFALDQVIGDLGQHRFDVFLSGPLPSSETMPDEIAELQRIDSDLCRQFLRSAHPSLGAARTLPRPNEAEGLDALSELEPDLIVSVRYRRILKEAAIGIPRHGVINLHSGLLPDYKGVMATFWAMLNDEPDIGCTLHRIVDSGIDTGPVIGESRLPTRPGSTYLANVLSLYANGSRMIVAAIDDIAGGGSVPGAPQDCGTGHYYSTPDREALARFRAKGLKLADGHELGPHIWGENAVSGPQNA